MARAKYRRNAEGRRNLERVARQRLASAQDAVAAFCKSCEPDLTCKTIACPLRGQPLVKPMATVIDIYARAADPRPLPSERRRGFRPQPAQRR
jgi:hypothetical protein